MILKRNSILTPHAFYHLLEFFMCIGTSEFGHLNVVARQCSLVPEAGHKGLMLCSYVLVTLSYS